MNKRTKRNNKCISLVLIFSMLLSVICVFPSFAEGEISSRSLVSGTSFADGVYVFNNRLTGKFLGSTNGTSFTMRSGTMASIGSTVQLSIRYIAGGYYDIRLNSNLKFLTRSATSSDKNITLTSSLNGDYSQWSIRTRMYDGYTYHCFRNKSTNEYLTWQNGTLQVVSSLPTAGTEAFYACFWRVAKYSDYAEPIYILIGDMWLPFGAEEPPRITTIPTNADLCEPHDFTYTCDAAYVGVDALTGYITPNNYAGSYTKTITATHKPTGITTTFSLTMNPKGIMLGIYSNEDLQDGHDHTSALSTVIQHLSNSGYSGGYLAEGDGFTVDEVDDFLDDNTNSIFVSRSHGGAYVNALGAPAGTGILINSAESRIYLSALIPTSLDLSNIRIAIFCGCKTGKYGDLGLNLPSVVVNRGARVAIGFGVEIKCGMANEWTKLFFEKLAFGLTVEEAVVTINDLIYPHKIDGQYLTYSVMEPYIAGDGTVTLN